MLDYRGIDEDDEDDEDDSEGEYDEEDGKDAHDPSKPVDDEELGGWGPLKKDYYNADAIETEQDALDEEAEARRIQKKQLAAMTEADFGFDEEEWLAQDGDTEANSGQIVTEKLPQLQLTDAMTEEEKLKILRTRYPEFEPISKEYLRLQPLHDELAAAANAATRLLKSRNAKSGKTSRGFLPIPMAVTKYHACAAYLAAMSMYFAILASTTNQVDSTVVTIDPAELHEHPIMESLLKCRELWAKIESLPVADPMVEASNSDELSVIEEHEPVEEFNDAGDIQPREKKPKKTKAQRAAEVAQAKSEARRAEKLRQTEQELAELTTLTDAKALKVSRKKKVDQPKINLLNAEDSDFGEETELTAHELAQKAAKKKSLRFYTSQITQKGNKRVAAGKDYGGDADVPHQERLKDRQARLQAQAEKRGQNKEGGPGALLGEDGDSSDEGDAQPRAEHEDEEGYYDMIAARGNAKKQDKLDRAAAYALAAKEGGTVVPEETIGEDGRRQITYAIEKNKGLTPRRAKQNRNPRGKSTQHPTFCRFCRGFYVVCTILF